MISFNKALVNIMDMFEAENPELSIEDITITHSRGFGLSIALSVYDDSIQDQEEAIYTISYLLTDEMMQYPVVYNDISLEDFDVDLSKKVWEGLTNELVMHQEQFATKH